MSRFLKSIFILSTFAFSVSCAIASSQYSANVTMINTIQYPNGVDTYTYFYVSTGAGRSSLPSCASGASHWIINNIDPDIAKQQVSLVLMAMAQGKPINIQGSGNCDRTSSGSTHTLGGELVQQLWITN